MTLLSSTVSIKKLEGFLKDSEKEEIANFVHQRFTERYIKPINNLDKTEKHGFSIMAVCCLMIESLESFKNGWHSTRNRSEQAFKEFLKSENEFMELKDHASQFYKHIRCGILHQSETTDGWKIQRKGELFDSESKTINASEFLIRMEKSLEQYVQHLKVSDWDSERWDNLRRKLRKIISNCGEQGAEQTLEAK